MKTHNSLLLVLALLLLSGCNKNKLNKVEDLKGVLQNQKNMTTVKLGVEDSEFTELYFLRNDAMHPRLIYIKIGNEVLVEKIEKFWKVNNFTTSFFKDSGLFMVRYKNNIDSAVLFSKYYLYEVQKIDPKKKLKYETTDEFVIQ